MQEPRQPPEGAAASGNALLHPGASHGTAQQEQLPSANPLTAQALQQLEQQQGFVPVAASTGQPAVVQPYFEHSEAPPGTLQQPVHHRSPLGPTALVRKDSMASTCSSTALLGRMSGISMQRNDFSSVSSQHQLQARLHAEQQAALQAQAAAATSAGPSTAHMLQQAVVGGSSTSSPPLSPGRREAARFSADGSSVNAGAMAIPVPPNALGLPAIATTLPGSLAGTSPPTAAGEFWEACIC
jgi:hypothetical protein